MRSTEQGRGAFDPSADRTSFSAAPGKVTLTQALASPAAMMPEHGASRGAFGTPNQSARDFGPTLGRSYVDEILGDSAPERAGDWQADEGLMSAMGLGAGVAPARGEPGQHMLASAAPGGATAAVQSANASARTTVPAARRGSGRSAAGTAHPATYLELGGERYTVIAGKLMAGREELGEVEDADAALGSLARRAPTAIHFRPADGVTTPAAGDLLAAAPAGSTVTSKSTVWVRSEGAWMRLEGKDSSGGGRFKGFTKSGGGSVRERLTEMTRAGQLRLSGVQIAALGAVAEVETGGQIGCVQTSDDQVVSIGFKQVVLGHGSLEKVMDAAPVGFAKHGLILDPTKHYVKEDWRRRPRQIAGCEDIEELRTPEWAIKFYLASMEPDVVAAICNLALADLRVVEAATASQDEVTGHQFFDDIVAKAWLLEVRNNRPAFMEKAVTRASATPAATREAFLDLLAVAIVETYEVEEPLVAYRKAKATYKKRHREEMSAEASAELLAAKQRKYAPIGRQKGTNIITKIPRSLTPADVSSTVATQGTNANGVPASPANPRLGSPPAVAGRAGTNAAPAAQATAAATPAMDHDDVVEHEQSSPQQESSAATQASSPSMSMRVTAAHLNVRSGPSTNAPVRGQLQRGDVIDGHAANAHWVSIQFRGQPGFVHQDHVEASGPARSSGSPPSAGGNFGIDDAILGIGPATAAITNAIGTGIARIAEGQRAPQTSTLPAPQNGGTNPAGAGATATPRAQAPQSAPLPVSALNDDALERLVAQISNAEVTSIASDLAGLKSRSQGLTRDRQEEQGEARDRLVEDIGTLRTRLAGLSSRDAAITSFKAAVYRSIQEIAPYYFQSRNIDILEAAPATQTRTCNLTVLGMALESLGVSAAAFSGNRASLLASARIYRGKIEGDDVSDAAHDATAGRGTGWNQLAGLRLPDFLELAAIARVAGGATDDETVKAAAVTAWNSILEWEFLRNLASDFGVTATTKLFDASGIQTSRRGGTRSDDQRIRAHGAEHRTPVEDYINARIAAEAPGRSQQRRVAAADRLRPDYDEAVSDTGIDDQVSLNAYRDHLLAEVGRDLDAGSAVIVGLSRHFVRLQSLDSDRIIVDDPARDSRSATALTYAEARAMGYFHMRFVIS